MATAAKILGAAPSSIAKICGTAKASVKYVSGVQFAMPISLIDSYEESNRNGYDEVGNESLREDGQALTLSTGKTITSVKFYLKKSYGSPTYNLRARIYTATGTVGANAYPTGSPLATSDNIAASTLTTSYALYEFTFSTPYTASAGNYVLTVGADATDLSAPVAVGCDTSSPTHGGNFVYRSSGTWGAESSMDAIFYLYGY